jgi:hypothetical protein
MTRDLAIKNGLIRPNEADQMRHECLRKVAYTSVSEAFTEAQRLAARSTKDAYRIRIYACKWQPGHLHIGNYQPNGRSTAGLILKLQQDNKHLLGRVSALENELQQARDKSHRYGNENGNLKATIEKLKKHPIRYWLTTFWKKENQ